VKLEVELQHLKTYTNTPHYQSIKKMKMLQNSKKVYISGKITGIESDAEIMFSKAEEILKKDYQAVINPMKLNHEHDKSWESYMRVCIKALCDCDVVFALTNHLDSRGARVELEIAKYLGLEIIYEDLKL